MSFVFALFSALREFVGVGVDVGVVVDVGVAFKSCIALGVVFHFLSFLKATMT